MDIHGSLIALAAQQHGVVARRQVIALGFSEAAADALLRRQGWGRLHHGVFAMPGSQDTPLRRASAALLAAHPSAAATGLTGLWLRGHLDEAPLEPRLVIPMDRTVTRTLEQVRVIASRTYDERTATPHRRLLTAPPARCLVDHCAKPMPTLAGMIDLLLVVLQRRATTLAQLHLEIEAAKGYPGLALLSRAVDAIAATGADSPFTRRVHERLTREGFAPDRHPVPVECAESVLHPDITFATQRGKQAGIECDGTAFHSEARDLARDARKDRAYKDANWEVERIGWWEFHHDWPGFLRALTRSLDRAKPAP